MPVVRHKKYVKYVIKNQVIVGGSLGSLKCLFVNTHGDWELGTVGLASCSLGQAAQHTAPEAGNSGEGPLKVWSPFGVISGKAQSYNGQTR